MDTVGHCFVSQKTEILFLVIFTKQQPILYAPLAFYIFLVRLGCEVKEYQKKSLDSVSYLRTHEISYCNVSSKMVNALEDQMLV